MEDKEQLVQKWMNSGFIRDVKPQHRERAAERLESAQRQSRGNFNRDAYDRELQAMEREGFFCSRAVNSNRR